jgi:hypothetical protein
MRTIRQLEDDNNRLQRAKFHPTNPLPKAADIDVITARQRNLQDNLYSASLKEEAKRIKDAEEQLKISRAQAFHKAECHKRAEDSRIQRLRNEAEKKIEERIKKAREQTLMDADQQKR